MFHSCMLLLETIAHFHHLKIILWNELLSLFPVQRPVSPNKCWIKLQYIFPSWSATNNFEFDFFGGVIKIDGIVDRRPSPCFGRLVGLLKILGWYIFIWSIEVPGKCFWLRNIVFSKISFGSTRKKTRLCYKWKLDHCLVS